jgi:acyl-CoA synthetase (AMP-forming)/AMP-acid ligase II
MFHSFGLIVGFISSIAYGATVVYPSRDFDAPAVVDTLVRERCTVLHGVPTMFVAILQQLQYRATEMKTVRTGMIGGMNVPPTLVTDLQLNFSHMDVAIIYGQLR